MTRAQYTRTSKRKASKSSQDSIPESCKENSPSILSQKTVKKKLGGNMSQVLPKKDISSNKLTFSENLNSPCVTKNKDLDSPIRMSTRYLKSTTKCQNNPGQQQIKKNVLCDKTNYCNIIENRSNKEHCDILKTIENKGNNVYKIIAVPKANRNNVEMDACSNKNNSTDEHHIPIYKTVKSLEEPTKNKLPLPEKEKVYEFEVDENEEPVQKKKRKKRTYARKPKVGPKALTINNIKYGSSESLVSLPEISSKLKKKLPKNGKAKLKPYTSVTDLHNEDSSYSVKSFMSHPPLLHSETNKLKSIHELSVLHETESEHCQSPHHLDVNVHIDVNLHLDLPSNHSPVSLKSLNILNIPKTARHSSSFNIHVSPNPKCYSSKTDITPQISHLRHTSVSSPNISSSSVRDFLSSTPCKKVSQIVCDNSDLDDSYDIPLGVRPSTGFIKDTSTNFKASDSIADENNFGFDEPEELEEPLLSPIKANIDLKPRHKQRLPHIFPWELNQENRKKPDIQEVIDLLKATLPKEKNQTTLTKETSQVFENSKENSPLSSPSRTDIDTETALSFRKPARRSYERQRRIRRHSDHEEELEEQTDEEKENTPQPIKQCYKKKLNASKVSKAPKVSKTQKRIAKEEEEMERLAAQMNAQFQEIEKVNLVVE